MNNLARKEHLKVVENNDAKAPERSLYELLFQEANDAILIVNNRSWSIKSTNRCLHEMTNYLKEELEGKNISVLFPRKNEMQTTGLQRSQLLNQSMLESSGFYEDVVIRKKDGYMAFVTLSIRTVDSVQTGGENLSFCIIRDIGEKKSMERDLITKHSELKNAYLELERAHMEMKSMQEALVQSGKLTALGELAAGVAHELNQPLLGVMGFSQELRSLLVEKKVGEEILDHVDEVIKNATRMRKIIQQLREFTRRSTEDFQEANITNIIQDSLSLLQRQFESRGIKVTINTSKTIPKIYCNPFQLEQVFINLATNARDAIEQTGKNEGKIDIRIQWPFVNEREGQEDARFLEIYFHDDGCGMNSEVKERALEPFFTTKEVGKGTGLGLSVSYGIISKIHGSILIESTPGKGTLFRLKLPVDYRNLYTEKTGSKTYG